MLLYHLLFYVFFINQALFIYYRKKLILVVAAQFDFRDKGTVRDVLTTS
jgi:hypothetical protein